MNLQRVATKLFSARVLTMGLSILGIVYFSRELGADTMGSYFLFQAVLNVSVILTDFGVSGGVEKRLSEGDDAPEFLTTGALMKLGPTLAVAALLVVFQSQVNGYLDAQLAVVLAGAIVLKEYAEFVISVLRGELKVGRTANLQLARTVTWLGVSVVLQQLGYGLMALVFGVVGGLVVVLVWGTVMRSTRFGTPSLAHARSLFEYSKYNLATIIGGKSYEWIDVLVLGYFVSPAHVAAYEVAWRITKPILLPSRTVASVIFPQISEWDAEGARERIETTVTESIVPATFVAIPAVFGVLVLSREILVTVFGPEFGVAWLVLIVLMVDKAFDSLHVVIGRALLAIDRPRFAARSAVVSTVANVTLNVVLVFQFGLVGAAVATAVASVLNDYIHYRYLSRFVTFRLPVRELSWSLLVSLVMCGVVALVTAVVDVQTVPVLLLVVLAGAAVYLAGMYVNESIRLKFYGLVDEVRGETA